MKETVVHDCAATGLYIGDFGSHAHIEKCNIIRNGNGSRPVVRRRRPGSGTSSSDDIQEDSTDDDDGSGDKPHDMVLEDSDDVFDGIGGFGDTVVVPPGHSGMYVETGNAVVEDSLLAGNSLTGLR